MKLALETPKLAYFRPLPGAKSLATYAQLAPNRVQICSYKEVEPMVLPTIYLRARA